MRIADRFVRDGRFEADGVGLEAVLAAAPTPLYLYSASTVSEKLSVLQSALPGFRVLYSLKANPNPQLVRLLAAAGAGAEVSSQLELRVALDAGVGPDAIVLVGPAKSAGDIRAAVEAGIHAVVVDAAEELAVVDDAAAEASRRVRVLLRVNTRELLDAQERMTGGPSKFGIDEERVVGDLRSTRLNHTRITGIQVYSASQVLDARQLAAHFDYVSRLANRLAQELKLRPETVDFGGGFGVPYDEARPELDLAPIAEAAKRAKAALTGGCTLMVESGRFLVAEAGVFVTRVVRVKESRGRVFVICDGGMNAFARPVLMRVRHPVRLLNRIAEPADTEVDVCGPICTPVDCIGREALLPRPRPGDVVGVFGAGAYGYTMSPLQFMGRAGPAELLAERGRVSAAR